MDIYIILHRLPLPDWRMNGCISVSSIYNIAHVAILEYNLIKKGKEMVEKFDRNIYLVEYITNVSVYIRMCMLISARVCRECCVMVDISRYTVLQYLNLHHLSLFLSTKGSATSQVCYCACIMVYLRRLSDQ